MILELGDFGSLMRSYSAKKHIEDAKTLLKAIKDQGWDDINWAAYEADNIDAELAQLIVDTGGVISK